MMHCFVNATIVDGSGAPPFLGTLITSGERISRIIEQAGLIPAEKIRERDLPEVWDALPPAATPGDVSVLDLRDKVISPGFIDAHSHNDWFCLRKENTVFFDTFLQQGITCMVTGNCGFSVSGFATDSPHLADLGGELFSVGDGPLLPDFGSWLQAVEGKVPLNVAGLLGHGTARLSVGGLHAVELTPEQEERMLTILEAGLQAGAAGISLGLMYAPGLYAPASELEKVAALCKKYDRILTVHPRAESAMSLNFTKIGRSHLLQALDELVELVRKTGCRFEYSHLIFVGRRSWRDVDEALRLLEGLQADGFEVGFDMYPFDFGASVITVILPEWYQRLDRAERRKRRVRLLLRIMIAVTEKMLGFGFQDIRLAYAGERHRVQRSVDHGIAAAEGRSAFDVYISVCEDSDFKARVLMSSYQNDEIVDRLMRHPLAVYMTDAWYEEKWEQNDGIYAAFPRFLRLGREKQMPLEAVIHKMTGRTAARFGLRERGLLRSGYYADLVIFDPQIVGDVPKEEIRTGGARVQGIEAVYVNGQRQPLDGDDRPSAVGRAVFCG